MFQLVLAVLCVFTFQYAPLLTAVFAVLGSLLFLMLSADSGKPPEHLYSVEALAAKNKNESGVYRCAWEGSRLHDGYKGFTSCWFNFENTAKYNASKPAFGTRGKKADGSSGAYEWKTWGEVSEDVGAFASGLVKLGALEEKSFPNEKLQKAYKFLGVTGKNRYEYYVTMQASYRQGGCLVPLYDTLGPDTFEYIINQTSMKTVVVAESPLAKQLLNIHKKCKSLKIIVQMDEPPADLKKEAKDAGIQLLSFSEVIEAGKKSPSPPTPAKSSDEMNTICYTSGTTGNPKGAFVTHKQMLAAVSALKFITEKNNLPFGPDDMHISYLPYAHIFERAVCEVLTAAGSMTAFFAGDTAKLVDDIQTCKPTVFFSVPRLYSRIYDKIAAGANKGGFVKKTLFNLGLRIKKEHLRATGSAKHFLWDLLVFGKTKNALGGRVRYCLTGAAPMSKEVQEFLRCCFCCPLFEGYGMTETIACGGMTFSLDPNCGIVGGPVPSVEAKVLGIPEMNYTPHDKDDEGRPMPRGELCLRGPSVFSGYFQNEEKTKEALDDEGWFHTGDVVKVHPNGAFQIIDRAKNIFKLAHGEYIAPEKIENVYVQAFSVAQAFVYGTSTERFLVAIVVPSDEGVKAFADKTGKSRDMKALCKDEDFKKEVVEEMNAAGKANKLNGMEFAKEVTLWPEPFTVENDLLTPSFKLKRFQAKTVFEKEIAEMYAKLNK